MLDNSGDPQDQIVLRRTLFPLNEMRQAANCSSRIQKAKVYGTHKPCKNKYFKG